MFGIGFLEGEVCIKLLVGLKNELFGLFGGFVEVGDGSILLNFIGVFLCFEFYIFVFYGKLLELWFMIEDDECDF